MKEMPDDEEVGKMLKEAQMQLKKQRGGHEVKPMNNNGNDIVIVSNEEGFRNYVTSSGKKFLVKKNSQI